MSVPKDYYNILGVERTATAEDVKRAYRKLAHEHHPDKGGDQEKFKEINEAYQVLSDDQKRSQYDQFGASSGGFGFDPFGAGGFNVRYEDLGNIGDIFSQFFGADAGFGAGTRTRPRQREAGADLELNVTISFEDMVRGVKRDFPLNRLRTCARCNGNLAEPGTRIVTCDTCGGSGVVQRQSRTFLGSIVQRTICPTCHGEGKKAETPCTECRGEGRTRQLETLVVNVPSGIESGTRLRIVGEGEAAPYGGTPGDLYVHVRVKEHKRFRREGDTILSEETIPFPTAALGGRVEVDTIDGTETLSIPRGTSSGASFTIKGKGIAKGRHGETGKRGDQRVTVIVDVPKHLTKRQEELLREFQEAGKKGFRIF